MRTAKCAQNVVKVVTSLFVLVLVAALSPQAHAQVLDLGRLHDSFYKGTDSNRGNPCTFDVGKPEKDFLNRRVQSFGVKTEKSNLDMTMILTGGQNSRPADYRLPNHQVQFNVAIDNNRIEIVTDDANTLAVKLFRVWGKIDVDDSEGLILECTNVTTLPR